MNIVPAKIEDIKGIIHVLKERCDWFKENNIDQWSNSYYTKSYNEDYFKKAIKINKVYVAKNNKEVIGVFLLKEEDKKYWDSEDSAYYIHHFATKIGYSGLGKTMLEFIHQVAKENNKDFIRLDCVKNNSKLNLYYMNQGFINKGSGEVPYSHNLWEKAIL